VTDIRGPVRLVLEDGTSYEGIRLGAGGETTGEVVFNTSMTGYQEMLTDPSYGGQILVPTYPLIGNYGVNDADVESRRIQVRGFVVREDCDQPSHALSEGTIHDYLLENEVVGISGVDTRAVTRKLRSHGVMMGLVRIITGMAMPGRSPEPSLTSPGEHGTHGSTGPRLRAGSPGLMELGMGIRRLVIRRPVAAATTENSGS
jgi:carbamoyl-phosphate synthase small subunit